MPHATKQGPATAVQHPEWCHERSCNVAPNERGTAHGTHGGELEHLFTAFGTRLELGLVAEHQNTSETEPIRVSMQASSIDEPQWGLLREEWFEPEEARLLARRLLEAADACEAARR